ncbi:DUF4129 domain-containing protein [Bacillus sp. 3255]|uniref:DUF4129 domain-containing protein n=1 Tax=Bacillus sp. 3255 TaxID=2817904 RepID=UPI002863CB29|nr:DUF4129 domain-containing protein [Bacillus sp. 3255]MDR6885333.1 hypothetical protein [Bacillus sp. 3255]
MTAPLQEQARQASLETWLRAFGLSWLFAFIELILFAPLVVLAHAYLSETSIWLFALQLLLCYVAGRLLGRIRWLSRTLYELTGSLLTGWAAASLFQGSGWHSWACAAIGLLLAFRGLRCSKFGWNALFPPAGYLTAGLLYVIAVPVMGRLTLFHPYMGWLNGLGFVSMVIFFCATHHARLLAATLAGDEQTAASSLSRTVKRSSRIWLMTLLMIIAFVGYFQQVRHALGSWLRAAIAWVLGLLQSDPPPDAPPEPNPTAMPPLLPPASPKEPSWLDTLFHYVQVVFGYLIVIAVVLLAVYLIVSKLAPALRKLLMRLMKRSVGSGHPDGSDGYIDEKEALVDWRELPRYWLRNRKLGRERGQAKKWSHLPNNRERVRYLYRLLIERAAQSGYSYNRALTPNETEQDLAGRQLPADTVHAITSAYNEVRYGESDITDRKLDEVLQSIEPKLRNHLK